MTATIEPEVGKARRRKEDARLITGRTRWTDNITLPGMPLASVLSIFLILACACGERTK